MNDLLTQLIECNQWHFIGRLGADPEMRYFESGASVCNAPLLINKPGQKRDDGQKPYRYKLELWREKAQSFADAARKGDLVEVSGRVKPTTWTDRNTGEQCSGVTMSVEEFEVLMKAGGGQQPQSRPASPAPATASAWGTPAPAAAPAPAAPPVWGSSAAASDDDVPF